MAQREEFHRVAHDMTPDELLMVMQTHLTIRADMPVQPLRDFGHWVGQHADVIERVRAENRIRFTEHFE